VKVFNLRRRLEIKPDFKEKSSWRYRLCGRFKKFNLNGFMGEITNHAINARISIEFAVFEQFEGQK
jgi:hypothetical protein